MMVSCQIGDVLECRVRRACELVEVWGGVAKRSRRCEGI